MIPVYDFGPVTSAHFGPLLSHTSSPSRSEGVCELYQIMARGGDAEHTWTGGRETGAAREPPSEYEMPSGHSF